MIDIVRRLSWQLILVGLVLGAAGLVSACGERVAEELPATRPVQPRPLGTRALPTLYPTATPWPSPTRARTNTPQPTSVPATEVAFDQLVVDVTYSIPVLGLERRIRGNVAGEIEVIDESSGQQVALKNRPGVIVEMQQALPRATIDDLPAGCAACVQIVYQLPLTGQAGGGWLRDIQLLASLENYTALVLGPHFPPGTIAGLRREATPFEVAHSAAIKSSGELWAWTATESQVAEPLVTEGRVEQAEGYLALIDWPSLPDNVGHLCFEGGGGESLFLDGPDVTRLVSVRCPEMYLPGQLVPIYSMLSETVEGQLEGGDVSPPSLPMTLDTTVLYRRADGARLSLSPGGELRALDVDDSSYTLTLTTTQTLSLTALLMESPLLSAGPSAIFEEDPGNVILVRGYDNVYELAWRNEDEIPPALVEPWNGLLELALQGSVPLSGNTDGS